ncbi:uncharacterized protein LOC119084959 isoform X2 [Bradysia coprophila]|nr:uncharacterized protein LOC119084959 isoform X2 [Bradysia coprophila]
MNESKRNEDILKAVNYELLVFADSLVPSKTFKTVANKAFQDITESIRRDPAFSVNRCILAGSIGKSTSVLFPDIDAVVLLNNTQHPLTDEIEAIMDLLKIKASEFGIEPSSITRSSKTVKLQFKCGIEMDLLPACQFSQDMYSQYLQVLDCIKSYPENFYMYSSSLAEIQTQFLKNQSGPAHQTIRLLKYWFKGLSLDVEINGGSYLMEILCAVVFYETDTPKSLVQNFKGALEKVANIDSLKVAFLLEKTKDEKLRWKLLKTDQELEQHKDVFSPLILQRPHFIIDPSNPFNDLLNPKNLTAKVVSRLKECAQEMLRRVELLDSIESNHLKTVGPTIAPDTGYPNVKLFIDKIFVPHAMSYAQCEELPDEIVVHVDFKYKTLPKSTDPRSSSFFVENKEAKKVSRTILNNLFFLIRNKARVDVFERVRKRQKDSGSVKKYVYGNGIPDVENVNDVEEAVETLLQELNVKVRYSSDTKDHESCDVTLYVPFTCDKNNFALRFSMKWKDELGEETKILNEKPRFNNLVLASLSIGAITIMVVIGSRSLFLCK